MIRNYFKILIGGRISHPREDVDPFETFNKMDSRLRGNDDSETPFRLNDIIKRRASPRGFTLLEVLVATAILGIAVAVILQLFSANLRALRLSEDYVAATKRAEVKMREVLDEPALAETSFSETTGDGYRIDVSVTNALEERTDTLPVKLLEISMTVYWTEGVRERSLSLSTMKAVRREQVL